MLYKLKPARVTAVDDKISIQLETGKSKRVRDKDVQLLHPGPVSSLAFSDLPEANTGEAWELLQGEKITLPDLSEFLFEEYTPASAWATWQVLEDGLYFFGKVDNIQARSQDFVSKEKKEREQRLKKQQEWEAFVERVRKKQLVDDDHKQLSEVEQFALEKTASSRILTALDIKQTPVHAHRFLVDLGYWPERFNPWPQRTGVVTESNALAIPALPEEERVDLTHLPAFAIDDEGSTDPDDAISIEGEHLWVHVADVSALVRPDSHLDLSARERAANLYLPEKMVTMLPEALTDQLGLGLQKKSPAMSFRFLLTDEGVSDISIVNSWIKVTRTSYNKVNEQMTESPFADIQKMTRRYQQQRLARNAAQIDLPEANIKVRDGEILINRLLRLDSRQMVTEAMLMAGEAAARFAGANDFYIPYAVQPEPEEIRSPERMSEMYAYRRLFRPSNAALTPGSHFGLGLELYTRATSPMRRYLDLVTHQQIRAFLQNKKLLTKDEVGQRIAMADSPSRLVRKAERLSNHHWKLIYLQQQKKWRGEATVVALEERKAVIILHELAMQTKIRLKDGMQLDDIIELGVREVDVAEGTAYFSVS